MIAEKEVKDLKERPYFPDVGKLILCEVIRSNPDKDCYLVARADSIAGVRKDTYYLLPKIHALKEYKQGDLILATVIANFLGGYQVVSQKIAKHLTNVLNLIVPEAERQRYGIVFKRSASLRRAKICKIGVFGQGSFMSFKDLNEIIKPYISDIVKHMPYPILIPACANYMSDLPKNPAPYLLNALLPAPLDKVESYDLDIYMRKITIYTKETYFPAFLHKDYINAKLASKLTKYAYIFVASDTGHKIEVDVYRDKRAKYLQLYEYLQLYGNLNMVTKPDNLEYEDDNK